MSPWFLPAVGVALLVLLASRRGQASTVSTDDVASGAVDVAASNTQSHKDGPVPLGVYREGQRVTVRQPYPFAHFCGKGPGRGASYAIVMPPGEGPHALPWESGKVIGLRDGAGDSLDGRFRRSWPTLGGVSWLPYLPQIHPSYTASGGAVGGTGQHGALGDGAQNPTSSDGAPARIPNAPERRVRSVPGLLARTPQGLVPMVEAFHSVNYSCIGLRQGVDQLPVRLWVGDRVWSAGYKMGGEWYHMPFAEVEARLAFIDPANAAETPKGLYTMRHVEPGVDPWSSGVYGKWLPGQMPGTRSMRDFGGVYRAGRLTPSRGRFTYLRAGPLSRQTGVEGGSGEYLGGGHPMQICFPSKPGGWSGAGTIPQYGPMPVVDMYSERDWSPKKGTIFNGNAYTKAGFRWPAPERTRLIDGVPVACEKNWLPYPPFASNLIEQLRAKRYVTVLQRKT